MAAVCSTPASLSLIFLTFCARSPPPTVVPPRSVATTFPAGYSHRPLSFPLFPFSALLHACLSLPSPIPCNLPPCLNLFFSPLFLCPPGSPSLSTSSFIPPTPTPPSTSMCTSYTPPCRSFPLPLPASLRPALPACLSTGKPRFLSLSLSLSSLTEPI